MAMNGKAPLVAMISGLIAVSITAIGWTIHSAAAQAERNFGKIERHCEDTNAHPVIQGKIDVLGVRVENVQKEVRDITDTLAKNTQKLDDIKEAVTLLTK